MNFLMVFLGGGMGCIARYAITTSFQKYEDSFLWATLLANVISSLILGGILAWFLQADKQSLWYLLLATGFCGGFSTFSAFSADNLILIQNGMILKALANIGANVLLCLAAVFLGYKAFTTLL